MKRPALTLCLVAFALLVTSAPAGADVFGPIGTASYGFLAYEGGDGPLQQALFAHDPAISGNGQYIAFDGYFGGLGGVWRRDLQTGEVQPVAVGAEEPGTERCVKIEEVPVPCSAALPSISENGQYVSFTTTAPLAPANDRNDQPDVYVRDMDVPESQPCTEEEALHPQQPCAYTLVSAVNGKAEALSYEEEVNPNPELGSVASGRSAMSANGQEVAFVTTAVSNLAGPGTPALQVAVRNLGSGETELVSTEYDPGTGQAIPDKPVSVAEGTSTYGAVYSPAQPTFRTTERAYELPATKVGASISGDGTTVAWMGTAVYKQARMLPDEDYSSYSEPLWRRIADGPLTPTRRVTGGSEPESPACIASGELAVPQDSTSTSDPCQGPFVVETGSGADGIFSGSAGENVPQLSNDGYTVAFLSNAEPVASGANYGKSGGSYTDLYVANMHEGLTRKEALRPLTELASGLDKVAAVGPILDLAVSPDGNQVAFTTQRTEFPLGSPVYVSQPAADPGLAELFDADLADDTLTRVTAGYESGPSEHPHLASEAEDEYTNPTDGALSPSFSDSGDVLAFASTASNLVYGDGNTPAEEFRGSDNDGSDVFYLSRKVFAPEPVETYISRNPENPPLTPEWRLGVTAQSLANGSVRLYVELPGAGSLTVAAQSAVRIVSASHGSHAGARRARSRGRLASAHMSVVERTVATAREAVGAGAEGLVELTLTLTPGYRALASKAGGLSGTVDVIFNASGHPALHQSIPLVFLRKGETATSKHKAKRGASKARRQR
jgi:hypothetical protein